MKTVLPVVLFAIMGALAGCASSNQGTASTNTKGKPGAVAVLTPAQGKNVAGRVTFTKVSEGVRVHATIEGLTPNGKHGFHIHEKGDCTAPDFSSAGGHFNPTGSPHGAPTGSQHHVGDFGNLQADASGKADLDFVAGWLTFDGTNSIIGRAVIVHEKADDLTTQPTGNAGARWACGIIQSLGK